MSDYKEPDVGGRVRSLREDNRLSLRSLADLSGLSVNAISRIERGESSPTVSSLHRLANALGVPINDFFEVGSELATILVRKTRRPRTRGEGMIIESLGVGLPSQKLEPFLMTLAPGATGGEDPIVHAGEEFVFCLEGEIEYLVGEEWHRLEAGDSMVFQATQPHLCRNTSLEPSTVIFIILAEDDTLLSRQQHLMKVGDQRQVIVP